MKSWWLSLLPILVCLPCLAISAGVAGALTAGLVATTGLLTLPVGVALAVTAALATALGLRRMLRHRQTAHRPLAEGERR